MLMPDMLQPTKDQKQNFTLFHCSTF